MKTSRRDFLRTGTGLLALCGAWPILAQEESGELAFDYSGNVLLAPDDPVKWPEFRRALEVWRKSKIAALKYDDSLYRRSEFAWSASNYSCCFLMLCDERFLNRAAGRYNVESFLKEGAREFGGFDSVVLWHAYPRIGLDERNQFDFYRDLPGGLKELRRVVDRFQSKGVRVYIDYNPWDTGTRREPSSDLDALVDLVRDLQVDGIFLDTMQKGAAEFRAKLDAVRPGVILESEGAVPLENLHDHHASWAQWFGESTAPGVLKHKWIEQRHMQHQVRRWNLDHSEELHAAWMNGSGIMVWENVFGSWMGWNARDRWILRTMLPIQRRFTGLFTNGEWTPLVPTEQPGIYASLWEARDLRLWTLINRTEERITGSLLQVDLKPGETCFDLVQGLKVEPRIRGAEKTISGAVQPRGIGCFLAGSPKRLGKDIQRFVKGQTRLHASIPQEASPQKVIMRLVPRPAAEPLSQAPEGMVVVPAATLDLTIKMRVRECGSYESVPPPGHKLADSFNFQLESFKRHVRFNRFAIDETPVTNAQFAVFLASSGYRPRHPDKFLAHWNGPIPPDVLADHPVVYVDLDDARAYARWAGKRLPTEEEWQYAAQGEDFREFPWGNHIETGRCNDGSIGGTTSVRAYPDSRSPFGCYDMCGNIWHLTESERSDGRTRFCIVRGGAWFAAKGSNWYMDGGPRPVNFAAKCLLVCPGIDRCSTVGFRCVADLE